MNKLFEIPIYALTREELNKKVACRITALRAQHPEMSDDSFRHAVTLDAHHLHLWDYNHIIGYITISVFTSDIIFDIFLPVDHHRYYWCSQKKTSLHNISGPGMHFYVRDSMSNLQIQQRTSEMLDAVIKTHIAKHYYVDRSAFDHINPHIDYLELMEASTHWQ